MFIGHYGAAFLARRLAPQLSLPTCFVACQLVDFLWAALVILGVEKVRLVPGFTASNPLDLYFMPYTHGLLAACLWSVLAAAVYTLARAPQRNWGRCALVLGAAVGSHWLLDLVVHVPDLPVVFDGPGYGAKYGLGLWNQPVLAALLELGLLWAGVCANLGRLKEAGQSGGAGARRRYAALAAGMTVLHLSTLVLPLPTMDVLVALQLLVSFSLLTWAAHWADRPAGKAAVPERAQLA